MSNTSRDKKVEPDDPMELHGTAVEGDARLMLDCLVEEYAHLGMGFQEIRAIFDDPGYRATNGLRRLFGPEVVDARILEVLSRCGVIRTVQRTTEIGATRREGRDA